MSHRCHLPGCGVATHRSMLMCEHHWRLVNPKTQREVYRTVRLRGPLVDASWAAWWRAAHRAIYQVMVCEGCEREKCDRWLKRQTDFADKLEGKP